MIVIAKHREWLAQLGLTTLQGAKAFTGEVVSHHGRRRDIFRITHPTETRLVLYLKRNWQTPKKHGLYSLLRRGKAWSIARREWQNLRALMAADIPTAEPVAYGEECSPLWEKFSFIITEAATGEQTVQQFIRAPRDSQQRRRVFDALAREIRRLHDAGL